LTRIAIGSPGRGRFSSESMTVMLARMAGRVNAGGEWVARPGLLTVFRSQSCRPVGPKRHLAFGGKVHRRLWEPSGSSSVHCPISLKLLRMPTKSDDPLIVAHRP